MTDPTLRPDLAPEWMHRVTHRLSQPGNARVVNKMQGHMRFASRKPKHAAVLMCFTGARDSVSLPLDAGLLITHRNPTMRNHSGQMAFPGGRLDPCDSGPIDAALREAQEETGLPPQSVTPLVVLESIAVGPAGHPVNPVLAYAEEPGEVWSASPEENDDVFFADLHELIDPANRFRVGRFGWSGPAFHINGYVVWGFTAALIAVLIAEGGWEEEWDHRDPVDLRAALGESRNGEATGL